MFLVIDHVLHTKSDIFGLFSSIEKAEEAIQTRIEKDQRGMCSILRMRINTLEPFAEIGTAVWNYGEVQWLYRSQDASELDVPAHQEFIYALMNDDPQAIDALNDVLVRGG